MLVRDEDGSVGLTLLHCHVPWILLLMAQSSVSHCGRAIHVPANLIPTIFYLPLVMLIAFQSRILLTTLAPVLHPTALLHNYSLLVFYFVCFRFSKALKEGYIVSPIFILTTVLQGW